MKVKSLIALLLLVAVVVTLMTFNHQEGASTQESTSSASIDDVAGKQKSESQNAPLSENEKNLQASEAQCTDLLADSIQSKLWRKNKRESVIQFFEDLGSDAVDDSVIASIGLYTELGVRRARLLATPELDKVSQYIYATHGFELYSLTTMNMIEEAVGNSDDDSLRKLLLDGEMTSNKYLIGNDSPTSLLSYIYETIEDKSVAITWMEDLIEAGAPITYWDLFSSNRHELPAQLIKRMFYASELSPTETFPINGRITSLAYEALLNQDYEMSRFWLELESPAGPDFFVETGLDLLVKFVGKVEPEKVKTLFTLLSKQAILPNHANTRKVLTRVIGEEEFDKYYPNADKYYQDNASPSYQPANEFLAEFYQTLLVGALKEPTITYDCLKILGKDLLVSLVEDSQDDTIDYASYEADVTPVKTAAERIDELADDILIDTKNRLSDEADILAELSGLTSIAGKLAYEKLITDLLREEGERRENEFQNQENIDEINKATQSLYEQVSLGNWDNALNIALSLEQLGYRGLDDLLFLSFSYNAPPVFIDRVLDRGAKLAEGFIVGLAVGNQIKLARAIRSHLNINFVDKLGTTTIEHAIRFNSFEMFQFLIENGANIHTPSSGLDALDVALQWFDLQGNSTTYLSTLISSGFKVTSSHREIVQIIQASDPEAYAYISRLYPQLL
jgi:hypothetical protein